jgi:hypothetical protein
MQCGDTFELFFFSIVPILTNLGDMFLISTCNCTTEPTWPSTPSSSYDTAKSEDEARAGWSWLGRLAAHGGAGGRLAAHGGAGRPPALLAD